MPVVVEGPPSAGSAPRDATETAKGVIKLAGDLTGSADAPLVVEPPVTLTILFENSLA